MPEPSLFFLPGVELGRQALRVGDHVAGVGAAPLRPIGGKGGAGEHCKQDAQNDRPRPTPKHVVPFPKQLGPGRDSLWKAVFILIGRHCTVHHGEIGVTGQPPANPAEGLLQVFYGPCFRRLALQFSQSTNAFLLCRIRVSLAPIVMILTYLRTDTVRTGSSRFKKRFGELRASKKGAQFSWLGSANDRYWRSRHFCC